MGDLIALIGTDRVMFGSDFPHPEGLADAAGYSGELVDEGLEADVVARIMGRNLLDLLTPRPVTV